jgi:ATP-dependent DNA helicase DinG
VPDVPALSRPEDLRTAVDAVFVDDGRLARELPAYEARDGQRAMAAAVADTLSAGGVLLAEAGTGTGKTLAYLVPAILSRQRVLISTGTKNLQEQIYFKDLPILERALDVRFTATYMKGRANYLCLHRLQQARAQGSSAELDAIADWSVLTHTGDRAELADLPEHSPAWSEVAATADTCLGSDCPQFQECFVTRMRQRAAASDLVIVNHHLLCADAAVRQSTYGEVIPDCHYAIIDEAHQLEDVATQYFGVAVSNYRLDDLGRDIERVLNVGLAADDDGALRRQVRRVDDHARSFFGGLLLARTSRGPANERLRVGPDWFGEIVTDGLALVSGLDGLDSALQLAATAATSADAGEDVITLARRAAEIRDQLRFLMAASDPHHVYFIETRGRGVFLRAAPIDVADILRDVLFERMRATILTSATLTVEGTFAYVRGRLGVPLAAADVSIPSEFDYRSQAVLYLPRRMPSPKAPEFGEAVARETLDILSRTRGRAFVLFTSYGGLRAVHERVAPVLPYPLFVQGDAPRSVLLQRFRDTPHAVLLATASFWQGVDVAGEQLSCVIIDKLPFASPGDPITAARVEAIAADGGDAFHEYQVPLAVLTMLQGLGRLIRHRDDRGVLAILDPRLRTMAYGRRFLDSFPPAPIVHDLAAVARFLDQTG